MGDWGLTISGEESVECHGQDVDDAAQALPAPMERSQLLQHQVRVCERRDRLRAQQFSEQDDVVERHGHAASCERVPHVHGVAEHAESRRGIRLRRQKRVGHAAELTIVQRCREGWLDALGKRGQNDIS